MLCGTVVLSSARPSVTADVERCLNGAPGARGKRSVRTLGAATFGWAAAGPGLPDDGAVLVRNDLLITCDSDLHDRDALREALGTLAPPGRDVPDSELLLAAYRAWGEDCPRHLIGEFAFAIWDESRQKLFCAVDPLRRRVLYRHFDGARLTFASAPQALLAFSWVDRKLNELAMAEFLAASVYSIDQGTTTFYEGIEQIPGAQTLCLDAEGLRTSEYWSPESIPETSLDEQACVAEYRDRLIRAVHRHLGGGRRVGVMLSGGFDSTAVACIAAQHLATEGRRLIGITAALPADRSGEARDARRHAESVARFVPNLDLHVITLDDEAVAARPQIEFEALHQPAGGFERRFAAVAAHAATLGVDVLLTGFGGDQAATPRGAGFSADMLRKGRWRPLLEDCVGRARSLGCSPLRVLATEAVVPLVPEGAWRFLRAMRIGRPLPLAFGSCREDYAEAAQARDRLASTPLAAWRPKPSIREQSCFGVRYIMRSGSITPMDRLSLAKGVRLRHPMFDRELVEFGISLPAEFHVRRGRRRHMMRTAGVGLLPPETLDRSDGNDSVMPDFHERMQAAAPQMARELDALEAHTGVSARIDFRRVRELFDALASSQPTRQAGQDAQILLRAYNAAHFIAWFERRNC